jgi:hypothetical protein
MYRTIEQSNESSIGMNESAMRYGGDAVHLPKAWLWAGLGYDRMQQIPWILAINNYELARKAKAFIVGALLTK